MKLRYLAPKGALSFNQTIQSINISLLAERKRELAIILPRAQFYRVALIHRLTQMVLTCALW